MSPNNSQAQHVVTAVVVAHDGAAWIPRVTEALLHQTRPVQRVVAVDTGSRDRSGAMLAESLGRAAVFGMDRATGYAAAVSQALRHRSANTHLPPPAGAPGERTEWVWLLHDDCEPEPDALEHLLAGAAQVPAAAVLGPKVMDWSDREVLLEAGIGIDRASRRVTGIEPREVDQGQHDGDRDVLAVGSAGMLVRRDVWDEVGGFDPGMLLYREDVDLCWRVQAAGYRVRVITDAVVYHVEASARNRRQATAAPRRGRQDRRNALLVLLGNLPAGPMLSALAGNLVLSTLRTLFFLFAKRPRAALDEVTAVTGVVGHPLRLLSARRRRSHGRRAAYSRLRADVPPGRSVRRLAEFASSALSRSLPVDMVGSHHATDDPSDDDSLLVDTGLVQRLLTNPGVLLFLVLTVISLVAERSLLSAQPLGGGALVPAWGGASDLWGEYLQGFHPAGIGSAASTPPYVAVIALLATLLGGKPWLAVDLILIGCVPLAGVTAYLASRRITRFVPVRVWAAMSYALLPVGMGAVAAGRLGSALTLVLLPVIGIVAARVFTHGPRRARRAAWAASLLVAVTATFVPLVWLIAVAAMAGGAFVFRRGRPAVMLDAAIVAVVPLVLLLPWSLSLATHPAQLFLEAGLQPPGLAVPGLAARSLLLLSPGGPGLPPYWVTGGVLLAAAVALVASGRRTLVLTGWSAAVLGLLLAAGLSRLIVTPPFGGDAVPAWPGVALALAAAGLLLAALAAGEALPSKLGSGRWRAPGGLAVLALALAACTAPALAAAAWVTSGVRGPVRPAAGPVLPEFVTVSSDTGLRPRTLVMRAGPQGSVRYSVLRDTDPLIGANELTSPPAAQRALNLTVAALAAPDGGAVQDQGRALATFGIGYVLLPAPVSPVLARLLDGVPGLRPVSLTASFELWRVAGVAARVQVVEPGGAVVPVTSGTVSAAGAKAPAAGGTLVVAEPAGGWSASLNGHPLTPLAAPVDGWAQGFRLPPGGGTLTVSRSQLGRVAAIILEALIIAVVAALGLPGARVAGETEDGAAAAGIARHHAAGRAHDKTRDRRGRRGGKAKPDSPGRPRVRRPPVPAGAEERPRGAAAGAARGAPGGPGGPGGGGPGGPGGPGGRPGGPVPAAAGRRGADSPTLVTRARGGEGVPGPGGAYPGGAYPPGPGRGLPGDRGGPGRDGRGAAGPGWPHEDDGRPGYQQPPARRGVRPGSDTGPGQPGPGRGRPGYDSDAGRGRPGYDSDAGRARPGYDSDAGRAPRPGYGPDPGRGGRPGYQPAGPPRSGQPDDGPDPGRGRAGYGPGAGGRGYGSGPGGYDTGPGRGGRPGYETGSGRGQAGHDAGPGQGDYGSPPGHAADGGGRRGRLGWPGRGGRSDRGSARGGDRAGDQGSRARVPRGRLPGDNDALSPLPPLPPRRRRPMDSYPADDDGADWGYETGHEPGERQW